MKNWKKIKVKVGEIVRAGERHKEVKKLPRIFRETYNTVPPTCITTLRKALMKILWQQTLQKSAAIRPISYSSRGQ